MTEEELSLCEHGIADCVYCSEESAATQALNLWTSRLPRGTTIVDIIRAEMALYRVTTNVRELQIKIQQWSSKLRTLGDER